MALIRNCQHENKQAQQSKQQSKVLSKLKSKLSTCQPWGHLPPVPLLYHSFQPTGFVGKPNVNSSCEPFAPNPKYKAMPWHFQYTTTETNDIIVIRH